MSNPNDKFKNSKRRFDDSNAVKKQLDIAQQHGLDVYDDTPHKLHKHRALNCGNPNCVMCGNPRRTFKDLTVQEKRMYQDTDNIRLRHNNGTPYKDGNGQEDFI